MQVIDASSPDDPFGDDSGLCRECGRAEAVGPCAACHLMICGECGVMSKDPAGLAVICLSCARLIADVRARSPERRPLGMKVVAIAALIAFGALALLL